MNLVIPSPCEIEPYNKVKYLTQSLIVACPHPTFFPEVLNNLAKASVRVQNASAWAATYRGITLYFKERHEEEKEISDMIGGSDGKGREGKGREGKGREGKGREGKGREGKGREGKGREGKGREGKGREGKGREGKGREGKGREGKGREGKGREGKGREGKRREGKRREGKGREGKGREGKGREGKGREEKRRAEPFHCFGTPTGLPRRHVKTPYRARNRYFSWKSAVIDCICKTKRFPEN